MSPSSWDWETDIMVVGSGFAGLAAAIEARLGGGEVVLIEKMKGYGGNSLISDGAMCAAGTILQKKAGITDTPRRLYEDMCRAGEGLNRPELTATVAEKSAEAFQWTVDTLKMTYRNQVELYGGHSLPRGHIPKTRTGAPYIKPMIEKAKAIGVSIRLRTALERVFRKTDGPVTGVALRTEKKGAVSGETEQVTVLLKKGLVVAGGGFAADIPFRTIFDPRLTGAVDITTKPSSTGETLKSLMAVGAMPLHLSHIQLAPWTSPDEKGYGNAADFTCYVAFPLGILVDPKTGERIVNEMGNRKERADAVLRTGNPCVAVADAEALRQKDINVDHALKTGALKRFSTWPDLASHHGIPITALNTSVENYNLHVKKRNDPEFGKPIPETAAPLQTPPFYTARVQPKVHHTMGGVRIDEKARVLDTAGDPIPRLFAAGEITGGVHGACRLGGCAITDCFVFGRIAGMQIR